MLKNFFLIFQLITISLASLSENRNFNYNHPDRSVFQKIFNKKVENLKIMLNCTFLSEPIEIYKINVGMHVKLNLNYDYEDSPFEFSNSTLTIKKLNDWNDIKSNYKLKLTAISNFQRDDLYLNINIVKPQSLNCLDELNHDFKKKNSNQIKILFADSLFSDFSELIFDSMIDPDNNSNNKLNNSYMVNLNENTQVDSFICYILVKSSINSQLNINGNGKDKFSLERVDHGSTSFISSIGSSQAKISPFISQYSLKLAEELDRELQDLYQFRISLDEFTFIDLKIFVNDSNDNEPKFERTEYEFNIVENSYKNNCIGFVRAIDNDAGLNGKIKYSFSNSSLKLYKEVDSKLELDVNNNIFIDNIFFLNESSGEICVLISLDRECYSKYTFEVDVEDFGDPIALKSSKPTLVVINVIDVNDNAPIFYEQNSVNFNISQKCLINNNTQSFYKTSNNFENVYNASNYPQFYIQENVAPNTFIAWLRAYDLDTDSNSQIDYYLEIMDSEHQIFNTQNYYEDHFFTIDSNGIIRSMVSFNVIDKQNSNTKSSIEIDESKVWIHKTNFLIKIIAKDRGKPSLQNEILINIKITNQKEKRKLILSLLPNKTTIWVPKDDRKMYTSPLVKIKVDESSDKLLYQLIPFTDLMQYTLSRKNDEENLEYGKNCSQTDIIKYFSLNKNGEIYLSKNIDNNHNFNNKSSYMVCFVNVRVIDLSNLYQMHSNIEFTFIIYNNNDSFDTSFESILLRDKLLKKLNSFKKRFNQMYKNKSAKMITNISNGMNKEEFSNSENLSFKLRKIFGEQNFNLNFYLLITALGLLLLAVFLVLANKLFFKRTKLFKSIQNNNNNNNSNTPTNFYTVLVESLKLVFGIKSTKQASSPISKRPSIECNESNSSATINNECKRKSFFRIFNSKSKTTNKLQAKDEEDINNKSISSTREYSNSNTSLEIKDDCSLNGDCNNIVSTESGVYSLKQNTAIIQNSTTDLMQNPTEFSSPSSLNRFEIMRNSNKIINNNCNFNNKNIDEIESVKSSLRSYLIKEENSLNLMEMSPSINNLNKMSSKNNCTGIFQISNQILIDYDDNTTCEINNNAKYEAIKETTTKSILKTDKNRFISNGTINEHADKSNLEPLERFEKIYYHQNQSGLTVYKKNINNNNSLLPIENNTDLNQNRNLSNFGSFV